MPAKFVVKKGATGKFRFNLLAANGEVIASSEAYNTKAAALKGVASVQKNAPGAAVEDQTVAKKAAPAKKTAAAKKGPAKKAAAKKAAPTKKAAKKKAPVKKKADAKRSR